MNQPIIADPPTVTVYGASDDLVEVEGAICEEFNFYHGRDDDSRLLAFSDGTVLRIAFTDAGIWRVTLVVRGAAELTIQQAPEDDERNYSDRAILAGDVRWVVFGTEIAKAGA